MGQKVTIKKNAKAHNDYTLTLKGMTAGKLVAIMNALENHNTELGKEVYESIRRAIHELRGTYVPASDMLVSAFPTVGMPKEVE